MTMKISDTIQGNPRGTAQLALSNIDHPEQIDRDYIEEIFRYAPLVNVDPAIVAAQWHLETGGGTSVRWRQNGNPAGLLVSQDNDPDPATFSGVEAARVHLWALVHAINPNVIPDWDFIPHSARSFVERWTAKYNDPKCPAVATIDDLNIRYTDMRGVPQATWAWDAEYQDGIVARSHVLFDDSLPSQEDQPVTQFSTVIPGLPGGALVTDYPIKISLIPAGNTRQRPGTKAHTPRRSVQHQTGNPSSLAASDAGWIRGGADGAQLSVHFETDDTGVWMLVPADEVTWQAADGNGPGNMNGLSCELTQNAAVWGNTTRRDGAVFIAADLMGRCAARLNIAIPEQHWTFNFALPPSQRHDCPQLLRHVMIGGKTAWDALYVPQWNASKADELKRMEGNVDDDPTTIDFPDGMDADLAKSWFGAVKAKDAAGKMRTYAFDPEGGVSALWLANGAESGRWPTLVKVEQFGDRRYFRFDDGLTIWTPRDGVAPRVLKAA